MKELLAKVWIPILVAIVTTLIAEYFAKPSLELRKKRLIRDRENFDEIVFRTQQLGMQLAIIRSASPIIVLNTPQIILEQLESAEEATMQLLTLVSRLRVKFVNKHANDISLISHQIGELISIIKVIKNELPSGNYIGQLERLDTQTEMLHQISFYFEYHRHWWFKKWVNKAEYKSALESLSRNQNQDTNKNSD